MRTYRETLLPNVPLYFDAGRFFMVVRSAVNDLRIKFLQSGRIREAEDMSAGFRLGPLPESERWKEGSYIVSATGGDVLFVVGDDAFDFDPPETVEIEPAENVDDADDVVLTAGPDLVAAQNLNRKSVTISSLDTNTNVIRVGGSNVAANRGAPLYPGGAVTLAVMGEVYAIGTVGETVAISEETN